MHFRSLPVFAAALLISAFAFAHDYKAGDLQIAHPHARATVPHQPSGAAYLSIENKGTKADKLLAVASPVARSAAIHTMTMDGNVMKMREVPSIELKPSEKVVMKPGDGYHIMLLGLNQPLKAGDKFPLTLTFENAGTVEVSVWVEDKAANGSAPAKDAAQHQHH
jgi:copper(I)-binding protein